MKTGVETIARQSSASVRKPPHPGRTVKTPAVQIAQLIAGIAGVLAFLFFAIVHVPYKQQYPGNRELTRYAYLTDPPHMGFGSNELDGAAPISQQIDWTLLAFQLGIVCAATIACITLLSLLARRSATPASLTQEHEKVTPHSSTIRRAWDDWWAQRDRWVTGAVQTVLMVLFILCEIMFFTFRTSQEAGPERDGATTKTTTVEYGTPEPWFHFVVNPNERTYHAFRVNFFASSVGIALLGFAFYAVVWQIEKAKLPADRQLKWWNGSPTLVLCVWSAMVIFAVLWGMHPLYLEMSN